MRKIGGGLATLESEGCLSVVGFCIKHEVAPRKPERVVKRVGAARCCVKRLGAGRRSQRVLGSRALWSKAFLLAADGQGGNCTRVLWAGHVGIDNAVKRHRSTVPVTRQD